VIVEISPFVIIYFFYGLAFFSMGLLVAMEGGRSSDRRLRMALRPLAGFGLVHAAHEWLEMFELLKGSPVSHTQPILAVVELSLMAFSFLSLAAFGGYLLLGTDATWRISLIIPLALEAVWVFGLMNLRAEYPADAIPAIADVWTRYSLAIPAGLLAGFGLIVQQRAFRRAGLIRFGQDSLWAAVCFGWYSLVGQVFTRASLLPPSTYLNEGLFFELFGFPIQLLRAAAAIGAAVFVTRFLRAFQVEADQRIAKLQDERLQEAEQREALRGELFRRVVAAQESERQRIARDLHDETGQSLTAIGLGLRGLTDSLPAENGTGRTILHRLQGMTADSLKELQRIISDLRPSHLDDLGLAAALRWYAGRLQELTPLNIKVEISGEEHTLDEAAKITVFRIIQEALNNVIKYAQASQARIQLEYREADVRLLVRDDGIGFDVEAVKMQLSSRPSLGLAGMEERAALLGGTMWIRSQPKSGTEIEAWIPYQSNHSEVSDEHTPAAGG
jgi:signal transduction histidine kinase